MGVSEQAKERERECFSLPLATVRGGRLQPVVFSLAVTHTYTHTQRSLTQSVFGSLARSPACWTPAVSFDIFPK